MLGSQTVTVRSYTLSGRDRLNAPIKTPVDIVFTGVSMQPMTVSETVTLTDVETEMWKCFLPPTSAALTITTTSEVLYNNMTFQVIGAKPGVDFMGRSDHVELDLKKQLA